MLRNDMNHASDAQAQLLHDKRAAAWWTYKPPPQIAAVLPASQMPHALEGAGRWIGAPAVRQVDSELYHHKQSSPRCMRARGTDDASEGGSPQTFHRRDWQALDAARESTMGSSLALPSFSLPGKSSAKFSLSTEAGLPSNGSSPLGASSHRRGRSDIGIQGQGAQDRSGKIAAPILRPIWKSWSAISKGR